MGIIDSGRTAKLAAASIAAVLVIISVARVASFERWVTLKSIDQFSALQQAIPLDGGVEVRVGNPLAFQWATYYLRNHRAAYSEGELAYYPASVVEPVNQEKDLKYLVTDKPRNTKAIWANGTFYLYTSWLEPLSRQIRQRMAPPRGRWSRLAAMVERRRWRSPHSHPGERCIRADRRASLVDASQRRRHRG